MHLCLKGSEKLLAAKAIQKNTSEKTEDAALNPLSVEWKRTGTRNSSLAGDVHVEARRNVPVQLPLLSHAAQYGERHERMAWMEMRGWRREGWAKIWADKRNQQLKPSISSA